ALAAQLRNPERVDHVVAAQRQVDGAAHGQVELVGGAHPILGISELPPPLVADDLHLQRVRNRRRLRAENRTNRRNGYQHEDQCRSDRPDDFKGGVAMHLLRSRSSFAVTELEDRVYEGYLDQHEDDRSPEEETIPEEV